MKTAAQEKFQRQQIIQQVRFIEVCAGRLGAQVAIDYMPTILQGWSNERTAEEVCKDIEDYAGSNAT